MFKLPEITKIIPELPHFPTRWQAVLFRASEFFTAERIARVLRTTAENIRQAQEDMGLPTQEPSELWISRGYVSIIRNLWHLLPYSQLCEFLETDEGRLAALLREEDFLDIKLQVKPDCEAVYYRELTSEEKKRTQEIKRVLAGLLDGGKQPFAFEYPRGEKVDTGSPKFKTRMLYPFSGLYNGAFDVPSEEYISDEQLLAYERCGINALWTQGILYQLSPFPFDGELSRGYERRLLNLRRMTERLQKFGIKLFLYLNEPRPMGEGFFERHPSLRGHRYTDDKICLCTSMPEVRDYITDSVELICREVPLLGGFFTITRSETPTNCYSHSEPHGRECTCQRCKQRSVGEVIGEVISCIRSGIDRVSRDITVMAWSWGWNEFSDEIIDALPERVVLLSQSELDVPFEIGGVRGNVLDYSMGVIGPGERARREWRRAKARGLELGAKVQVNTTWEASSVPAIPVIPLVEEHIEGLMQEGVSHLLMSWTLGGYPSANVAMLAKYFFDGKTDDMLSERERRASEIFSAAFREFPFHIDSLYYGPQNSGPASLLYERPTGLRATMTCYPFDDVDSWRGIYPREVYRSQYEKLVKRWGEGMKLITPDDGIYEMALATHLLFISSLNQVRFYDARDSGDFAAIGEIAASEGKAARRMLSLMKANPTIGYEASNHYLFTRYQLAEKIIQCEDIHARYKNKT